MQIVSVQEHCKAFDTANTCLSSEHFKDSSPSTSSGFGMPRAKNSPVYIVVEGN